MSNPNKFNNWIYILLCFIIFPIISPSFCNTIIIGLVYNDSVFVAADSRRVTIVRNDSIPPKVVTACKIYQIKNIFFTFSGNINPIPIPELCIPEIAKYVFSINDTPMRRIIKFDTILEFVLTFGEKIRARVEARKPIIRDFRNYAYMVAGVENTKPFIYIRDFTPRITSDAIIFEPSKVIMAQPGNIQMVSIGITKTLEHYKIIESNKPVDILVKAMNFIFGSEPDYTGPPIDIIKITRNGSEWIQRKQECYEQDIGF